MCYVCGLSRCILQMPFDVVRSVCHGHVFVGQVAVQHWPCYPFGRGVYTTAEQVLRALCESHALRLCTSVMVIPHMLSMVCMTASSLAPLARLTANK